MEDRGESFNMAVATLMRLDDILRKMGMVSMQVNGITEQKYQIKLLRHFFLNASPLMKIAMDDKKNKEYKQRMFSINIKTKIVKGKLIEIYSPNLDDQSIILCMEVQDDIKNFFMPPARKQMF